MVPADSRKVSPASRYSGYPPSIYRYTYRPITFCGAAFQAASISDIYTYAGPTTPQPVDRGLGSSPFARHYLGNHYCFLFLRVLRCFSSPGLPSLRNNRSSTCWVVPFGNLRIKFVFANTRSLSQLITSFIASKSLGILHTPLLTFSYIFKYF